MIKNVSRVLLSILMLCSMLPVVSAQKAKVPAWAQPVSSTYVQVSLTLSDVVLVNTAGKIQ